MAKILLVEDDKSLREIYGVRLMAEGYQIVSAGDGEEALAMAIKERPDLIVSDVMMPKISGFDMLDILRSTTETKDVKVIMMTALSSEDQRARGEALGADRYLVKSQVGIEDVVRTVHDVLGDSPNAGAPNVSAFAAPAPEPAVVTPAPLPVAPAMPVAPAVPIAAAPEPIATPAPSPIPAPFPEPAVVTPAAAFTAPVTAAMPAPPDPAPAVQPVFSGAPTAPPAPVAPSPAPLAMPAPTMPEPVTFTPPAPFPAPVAPAPIAPAPQPAAPILPQPTAPFSSPRPASLGDRVINPISPAGDFQVPPDMNNLMNQELNGGVAQQPPVPPAQTL